jgi:hypothetical protein
MGKYTSIILGKHNRSLPVASNSHIGEAPRQKKKKPCWKENATIIINSWNCGFLKRQFISEYGAVKEKW